MKKDSRIFIAGHRGMVGSAILRKLKLLGYENLIVRNSKELDLRIQADTNAFFEMERPEYIFMAAARVGGIQANSNYPVDFLMDNLMIQNNIFNAAWQYKTQRILFLASSCIFPKEAPQPMTEDYILSGKPESTNEPYAIAKIAGLKACAYYNHQYGTSHIAVTPANCYGINDCFEPERSHVIPALIQKYYNAKTNCDREVVLWGTGSPLREFLFVDDLAEACVFLMNKEERIDLVNIGSGQETSILALSHLIKKIIGFEGDIICDTSKPDGMMRRMVDCSKMDALGWHASTNLESGLAKTYDWFLQKYVSTK